CAKSGYTSGWSPYFDSW
nr:immunoglobulin heavy chain junction region [Macaca mulatta]